jgi:hypothetical protein
MADAAVGVDHHRRGDFGPPAPLLPRSRGRYRPRRYPR